MNLKKNLLQFKATIGLVLVLIIAFLLLSNADFFIPIKTIKAMAFSMQIMPMNIIWFWVVHAGYAHLIANCLALLVFGVLVERNIGSKHTLGLFLVTALGAPLLFTLFVPSIQLVGASGGVAGLIATSLVLDTKKAVLTLLGALLLIGVVVIGTAKALETQQQNIQEQKQKVQSDLNQAIQRKDKPQQEALERQLNQIQSKHQQLQESTEFQETIPIENNVHGIGAILGIVYLQAFFPSLLRQKVRWIAKQIREF